jgi:hypothetical protein
LPDKTKLLELADALVTQTLFEGLPLAAEGRTKTSLILICGLTVNSADRKIPCGVFGD